MPPSSTEHARDDSPSASAEAATSDPFHLDWDVCTVDETTLVTVRVTNTLPCERMLRLENRLDGPLLPPRRNGVCEAGWDERGLSRSVPGKSTIAVGYACRAPPREPPVTVSDSPDDAPTASPVTRALRSLGDHAPPRAAVVPDEPSTEGDGDSPDEADVSATERTAPSTTDESGPPTESATDGGDTNVRERRDETTRMRDADAPVPQSIRWWFDAVDARLETVDELGGTVSEATPVIATLGGRRGVETLDNTLADDARALRTVAARAETLARRVEERSVPDVGQGP